MKNKFLLIFFIFILFSSENFGQNNVSDKSLPKPFIWPYTRPDIDNIGPMDVLVNGTYHFVREIIGSKIRVNVVYNLDKITFHSKYGDLRFKYKGEIYKLKEVAGTDGLDPKIGWDDVGITGINISIKAFGVKNARRFDLNSNYSAVVDIGEVERDKDLNNITLELASSYATNIYFDNSIGLQSRLDKMIQLVEDREEYKKNIAVGNNYFNNDNLESSKEAYQKALKLFPNESYPQSQIAKIDAQIKTETTKKLAAETDDLNTKSASKTSPTYNSSSGNSAYENTSSEETASQSNGGSGQLSEKVKVNGQYVQVFKQGGKYYMVNADGSQHETTQYAYDAIQNSVSKKPLTTSQNSTTETVSQIPSLESQYEKLGIPANTPTYTKQELTTQLVTQGVDLVAGILTELGEEKRQKEAYQAQLREAQAERERAAAQIRREKITTHTNFITAFKDAKLPLSSSNIEEDVIYYFAFCADKSALATTNPTINITDIFPIAKYNDDTWPFSVNIKKELSNVLKSTDIVLIGYYKSKTEAETDYFKFKNSLEKLNFLITTYS